MRFITVISTSKKEELERKLKELQKYATQSEEQKKIAIYNIMHEIGIEERDYEEVKKYYEQVEYEQEEQIEEQRIEKQEEQLDEDLYKNYGVEDPMLVGNRSLF